MKRKADVCLVLEGTYPFVSGGVSSWVHHLVSRLPHLRFSILHISPIAGYFSAGPIYDMPENVVSLDEVHLHRYRMPKGRVGLSPAEIRARVERFRDLVRDMQDGATGAFAAFLDSLQGDGDDVSAFTFLQSRPSWDVLVEAYEREARDESFLNFFWTWRYTFFPLLNVLRAKLPPASIYHTISTGYAGLLASAAKVRNNARMLLTEHGIYTKERRIEINRADWIEDWDSGEIAAQREAPYFKRYWTRQFQMMSGVTYEYADEIFTLYGGNRVDQIRDGADPAKIRIIPNGIDLERFGEAARVLDARGENRRFTVGFVGRVCPIKDVRTLVAAMRLVANEIPNLRVRVLGPMEEDPEYAADCIAFARGLGLGDIIAFEGRVDVLQELPTLDVMVLTSISEAQPLVILEAGAVGVPVVATDVGSCSELLGGASAEDRAIGAGGLVTPMASPGETARAVLRLARDPEMRAAMRDAMRERVRRFYAQEDMVAAYDEIYLSHLPSDDQRAARPRNLVLPPAPGEADVIVVRAGARRWRSGVSTGAFEERDLAPPVETDDGSPTLELAEGRFGESPVDPAATRPIVPEEESEESPEEESPEEESPEEENAEEKSAADENRWKADPPAPAEDRVGVDTGAFEEL